MSLFIKGREQRRGKKRENVAVYEQCQYPDNVALEESYAWGVLNTKLKLSFVAVDVTKWKQYPVTPF